MRDVFPYEDDRNAITAFMAGREQKGLGSDITSTGKMLYMGSLVVAYYDTGGAMASNIGLNAQDLYVMRVINEILRQAGDQTRVTREALVEPTPSLGLTRTIKWFLGDEPIELGAPFVIMGPMSVMAYRAQHAPRRSEGQI